MQIKVSFLFSFYKLAAVVIPLPSIRELASSPTIGHNLKFSLVKIFCLA